MRPGNARRPERSTPGQDGGGRLWARLFAVVAAAGLVTAFALATLLPPTLTLAQMIARSDHALLLSLQDFVRDQLSPWLWTDIVVPVLGRPCWLIPATLGLVATGLSVTLGNRATAPRSRRRRS